LGPSFSFSDVVLNSVPARMAPTAAFWPWSSYGAVYIIAFLALLDDIGVE
jgi:hypothetical protein